MRQLCVILNTHKYLLILTNTKTIFLFVVDGNVKLEYSVGGVFAAEIASRTKRGSPTALLPETLLAHF